jgi:hypothetical protein
MLRPLYTGEESLITHLLQFIRDRFLSPKVIEWEPFGYGEEEKSSVRFYVITSVSKKIQVVSKKMPCPRRLCGL